jgi:hypothetical protein
MQVSMIFLTGECAMRRSRREWDNNVCCQIALPKCQIFFVLFCAGRKRTISEMLGNSSSEWSELCDRATDTTDEWRNFLEHVCIIAVGNGDDQFLDVTLLPEKNTFLTFTESKILVRSHYKKIHEIIHDSSLKYFVVTGNPGIGKTHYLLYELYCLKKNFPSEIDYIVFGSRNNGVWYIFDEQGQGVCYFSTEVPPEVTKFLYNIGYKIFFLYDCANKDHAIILPTTAWKTIITTSPDQKNYSQTLKNCNYSTLYMPTWTKEELKLLTWKRVPEGQTFDDMFYWWGGIPRFIYGNGKGKIEYVERLINTLPFDSILGLHLEDGISGNASHKIVQCSVVKNSDYKEFSYVFASQYVSECVFKAHASRISARILDRIQFAKPLTSLDGHFFETLAQQIIPRGGVYRVRCLSSSEASTFPLPKLEVTQYFTLSGIRQCTNMYYQPVVPNQGALDSFAIVHVDDKHFLYAFQVTTAQSHNIKKKEFKAIEQAVGKKISALYFVLPKNIFDERYKTVQKFEGTKNNILTVDFPKTPQYALCIDKHHFAS